MYVAECKKENAWYYDSSRDFMAISSKCGCAGGTFANSVRPQTKWTKTEGQYDDGG